MEVAAIRNVALGAIAMALFAPFCRAQTQLAGEWQGTLSAGGVELRLVLHITAGTDGALTGTLDSIDQGALGIPVTTISLRGAAFSMAVDAVHGTYDGTVNKDATEIDGTWTQMEPLPLNFKRTVTPPAPQPAAPTELDGTWTGTLDAGQKQLRIVFKITNTTAGETAQLQSPDQSPAWIPATSIKRDGASLTIDLKGIGATFAGKIAPDLDSIDGTFLQMGNPLPLTLRRAQP